MFVTMRLFLFFFLLFFFFHDTATTEIYTLSLHDALPICSNSISVSPAATRWSGATKMRATRVGPGAGRTDRKSTRLNSSHTVISYAVFCLKKKKKASLKNEKINKNKPNTTGPKPQDDQNT